MDPTRTLPVLAVATLAVILNSLLGAFAQPVATTLGASGVTTTSATLNGTVNPNGAATTAYFRYGLTTNYGSYSATNALVATNTNLFVSKVISNLTRGATYHFQLVASNSVGGNAGADVNFAVGQPTYSQAVLADHPFGYWRLDETNGSVAHDYFGANNGAYTNALLGQPGNTNLDSHTAVKFGSVSNVNSYVGGVPIDFGTSLNAAFSVECWAKGGPQTNGSGLIARGPGTFQQFALDCGSASNAFRFVVRDGTGGAHAANGTVTPDNTWHHLVGVCDEANGNVILYVDGVYNASGTITPGSGLLSSGIATTFGARQSGTGPYDLQFIGSLEEVAIYTNALSPAQVQVHYQDASEDLPPVVTTLAATSITATNATLHGTINPKGSATLGYFQYGLTTNYGYLGGFSVLPASNATLSLPGLVVNSLPEAAGTHWTQTSAPNSNSWYSIASSADGTRLAAVKPGGGIWTSTNSGITWQQTSAPSASLDYWHSIASSADGTRLAAVINGGTIWTSTNSGITWQQTSAPVTQWHSIASSADGMRLVAGVESGFITGIFTSTDGGVTWTQTSAPTPIQFWNVASSAGGTALAAAEFSSFIWTSTDGGVTWTQTSAPGGVWSSIASSADGMRLAAASYPPAGADGGGIWTSTNSGVTWQQTSAPSSLYWNCIASSADGMRLAAVQSYGGIWTSTDGGGTWTESDAPGTGWMTIASSGDGMRLAAGVYGGGIWTSVGPASHLQVGTLYNYRLVGINKASTVVGSNLTFITGPFAPPVVSTLAANCLTTTNCTLNGTVNPNGAATTAYFRYGLTTNYGSYSATNTLGATNTTLSVSNLISNLTANTTYHFQLVASNSLGTALGGDLTFTTPGQPVATTQPATSITTTNATLNGTVNPNWGATTAFFRYGLTTNYGSYSTTNTLPATNVALSVSTPISITLGTTYHFQLVASNIAGTSLGNDLTLTISPYGQAVLADNPIGYWPLAETNGPVARDFSGSSSGFYTNALLGQPGNTNLDSHTAVKFGSVSNVNSYVGGVPIGFATPYNATFSVECWANGGPQTSGSGLIAKGTGNGEQFALDCGSTSNAFRFFIRDLAGRVHAASGNVVPDNTWHHLVGVCDEANGVVRLYVDGLQNSLATFAASSGLLGSANATTFGSRQSGAGAYDLQFIGSLEEIAIYPYALGAGQVLAHYQVSTYRPPTASNLSAPQTYTEDTPLNLINIVVSDPDSSNVTATLTLSNTNAGSLSTATSGTVTSTYDAPTAVWTASGPIADVNVLLAGVTFTPSLNFNANFTIGTSVSDGVFPAITGSKAMTGVAVNDPPTLNAISNPAPINEDAGLQTVNLSGITAGGGESQTLTVTATSGNTNLIPNPAVTYTSPNTTGSLSYTPVANASGTALITVTVNDGGASNNITTQTFTVTVNPVNDPPTLNPIANPAAINEDAGLQTVSLSGITAGGGESQTLTVTATSGNTNLIPNPAVTYTSPNTTGSLSYTPVANASGTALITVTVNDGGASNNITSRTFTVTVNPVNDPPTLNPIANPAAINEDAGLQTVNLSGITAGGGESQTLTVTATSGNTNLIPNPTVTYTSPNTNGSLSYTPVANASGTALITVTVNDGGASNNITTQTFTVTVNPVNDPPTLNAIANPAAINEDAGLQTVNLSGITAGGGESQTLTVTATSGNTNLIPNPTVTYTSPNTNGSLSYTPVANASGTALITVTVDDGGASNNITTQTFTVTVNTVNDPPTLNAIANPAAINEDAGLQTVNLSGITAGGGESQTLTVTATSGNTNLIPNPTVTYTSPNTNGSLSYTPVANASGTALITVTVNDGGASNNITTQTFTVTVNPVNDPPTLNAIANPAAINEDAGLQTVNLSGITAGGGESQTLTVTATSGNTNLIPNPTVTYTSPNTTGSLSYTPVANASGTALITVTVNDGGASNNITTRTFTVAVNAVNDPPTLNAIANPAAINEDAGPQTVNLSGITAGGGESQTLTVTATSGNTNLIPNPAVTYISPNTNGSLSYKPLTNANGTALITVTINDGGTSNNITTRTFTVTVNPINDMPVFTKGPDQSLPYGTTNAQTVVNWATGIDDGDPEVVQTLTFNLTNSNPAMFTVQPSVSTNGTLTYTPNGTSGTATIGVSLTDDATAGGPALTTAGQTFTITVAAATTPPPPVINSATVLTNGAFQLTFTNTNNIVFSVLGTTNLGLPASNWTMLGTTTNIGGGLHGFTDSAATNLATRYYLLRFP
jgi:hypothetical protein